MNGALLMCKMFWIYGEWEILHWRENDNLQNISAVSNCVSNINDLILKALDWINRKKTKHEKPLFETT